MASDPVSFVKRPSVVVPKKKKKKLPRPSGSAASLGGVTIPV